MAKKYTPEEFYRIEFGSADNNANSSLGGVDLARINQIESKIISSMESASRHAVNFSNNLKKIDDITKDWSNSALVHSKDFENAKLSAEAVASNLETKLETPISIMSTQEMVMLEYNRKRKGALAKSLVKQEIESLQGTFQKTNTDTVRLGYPVSKAEWLAQVNNFGGDTSKAKNYFGKLLDKELKGSSDESKILTRKEAEKEKERKEKEEQKQKEKEEKESNDSKKSILATFMKTVAILGIIANICRRILTQVLKQATEVKQQTLEGKSLGLTYEKTRRYANLENTMGLGKGTVTSGISAVQDAFGDIRNINQGALKMLAPVLGAKTTKEIELGLGRTNPEAVYKMILDAFFKSGQMGVNSVGQSVGREEAERELATALDHAGLGELAKVLRNMFYTNDKSIYRGMVSMSNPFESYTNISHQEKGTITPLDQKIIADLGEHLNSISTQFALLSDLLKNKVLFAFEDLIKWIDKHFPGSKSATDKVNTTKSALESYKEETVRMKEGENYYAGLVKEVMQGAPIKLSDEEIKKLGGMEKLFSPENIGNAFDWKKSRFEYRKKFANFMYDKNGHLTPWAQKAIEYTSLQEAYREKKKYADKQIVTSSRKDIYYSQDDFSEEVLQKSAQEKAKKKSIEVTHVAEGEKKKGYDYTDQEAMAMYNYIHGTDLKPENYNMAKFYGISDYGALQEKKEREQQDRLYEALVMRQLMATDTVKNFFGSVSNDTLTFAGRDPLTGTVTVVLKGVDKDNHEVSRTVSYQSHFIANEGWKAGATYDMEKGEITQGGSD